MTDTYAEHVSAGYAERVLVDGQDAPVEQQSLGGVIDSAQVDRHEQLGREYRPETHLNTLLVATQTVVAHYQLQHSTVRY